MQKIGKLNSSIDIIPLQSTSNEKLRFMDKRRGSEEHVPNRVLRDPLIISRVQAYMFENEDKIYIDVNEMADFLQRKYRDYRGKKKGPFRAMVRKAYDEISDSYVKKTKGAWRKDDEDEVEDLESDEANDTLNNELLKMYKKSMGRQNGNSSDKELIDISSDDDQSREGDSNSKKLKSNKDDKDDKDDDKSRSSTPKTTQKGPSEHKSETGKKRPREKDGTSNDSSHQILKKKRENTVTSSNPPASLTEAKFKFCDVGGSTKVLETVCKLLVHMRHPEVFDQLGIPPPRGFLLHGPPGCGKTLLAQAIAGELELPLLKVAAPELVAGVSGESEARIRELFEQAIALSPCILFLDEIDAIAPHRATAQREMERRIVAQLLSCLDDLNLKENGERVLVIGATNRPDSLDPALRRAGRFDREVCLGIPDKEARIGILKVHTRKVSLGDDISLEKIASLTPGYVGADLVALIREAATVAVNRIFEGMKITPMEKVEIPVQLDPEDDSVTEVKDTGEKVADRTPPDEETFENCGNVELIVEEALQEKDEKKTEESTIKEDNPEASKESGNTLENNRVVQKDKEVEAEAEAEEKEVEEEVSTLANLLKWLQNEPPISSDKLSGLSLIYHDFEVALKVVQPSAKREGFATVPDVTWDDIGSLQDVRQELQMSILAPVRHSEHFHALGLTTSSGVLLCGPPGCGKTLLAKAIANEAAINFISVKGPELLNMYVGESEKAVRQCFIRARNSAPCVIFFDELDALCPKRSQGDSAATSRVVNQMLTEMDGVEGRKGVFLMAATNRPDIIDPAVLRPGRLEKILYVGLPTPANRVDILRALTKNGTKPKLASDVNLEEVGMSNRCDGFTGADLAALIREAGMAAVKDLMEYLPTLSEISMRHISIAFEKVKPSVHEKDIKHYEKLRRMYSISKSPEVTPMETPMEDPETMEAMET